MKLGSYIYKNRIIGFIIIVVTIFLNPVYADDYNYSTDSISTSSLEFPPIIAHGTPLKISETDPGWNKTSTIEGVTNYEKPIAGTDLNAYKGVCVVETPLNTILSILKDVSNHSKWVKYCIASKTHKKISENSAIQYYDFDIPWPMENRDIVIESTLEEDWENGRVVITGYAVDYFLVPIKDDHLRITQSTQKWILEEITPDKTLLTFVSATSIDGSVPKMFNNLVSTTIPSSSILNLKNLSTETYYATLSRYVAKSDSDENAEAELF